MKQIIFEKLPDGDWEKIQDDPEDENYEIIDPVSWKTVYSHIENLKRKGWKVKQDMDPSFDGFVLFKEDKNSTN